MNRWWTIHDDELKGALMRVEMGHVSADEVYAQLIEHSEVEDVQAKGRGLIDLIERDIR